MNLIGASVVLAGLAGVLWLLVITSRRGERIRTEAGDPPTARASAIAAHGYLAMAVATLGIALLLFIVGAISVLSRLG